MPNYTHEEMNNRIREIQAQSRGRISRKDARKQAEAESNYEKPVGQGFQNVEDEVSLGSKAAPEAPSHSIEPRDIRRADKPVPPDPLPEESLTDLGREVRDEMRSPEKVKGSREVGEASVFDELEQSDIEMEALDRQAAEDRERDEYNRGVPARKEKFEKDQQTFEEGREKYKQETQDIIAQDQADHEERLKNPNHPGYVNPKDQRDADRAQDILDNLGSGGAISPEDSKWVQKYRAEQAAKEAKRLEDIRSGAGRYIGEDAATTDTAVAGQLSAEDRAREAAGIPVKRKIHPPKAASDGRMLPMITHDPSLTRVIEVFDPPGSDNLVNRIVEDIPGARKELAQRKGAEGKVRMRQAEGGYARAADDEPYSRGDIYMSDSQAGRAESTAEKRIRDKARGKALLARNRLLAQGWRDPSSPMSYGKDAAAVKIAQIAADAEKAKAEAEAKIKSDDTLSDHEKQLAIIKATGEINANAAAAQNEFDARENRENRQSAETVAGVEQEQTATALQQVEWERQRDALESELSNQQAILTDSTSSIEDMKIAREKIKNLREKLRILNNQILGAAATDPAQADDTQQFLDDGWEEVEEDEGDGGAAGQAVGGAGATNALSVKDATQYLTVSEPQLLADLNTDAMNEMFTEDNAWSFDESDLMDLYVKLKEFFDSKKINSTNIAAAGPYINSKLAAFHRATLLEFKGSTTEAEGDWFIDIPGTTRNDIYEFFEAIKNGNMPRGL